jgi:tetratricopeptide (TPR) repeat protein
MLTVPEGRDPLDHRAEMTAKYGARTLDMVRTAWQCPQCRAEVPPPAALVLPFAPYRSLRELGERLASAANDAVRASGGAGPCPRCGAPAALVSADQHVFSSLLGKDLVVRHAPGAQPQLFAWSQATGPAAQAYSPELDRAIARDAILRAAGSAKEDGDDQALVALITEGAQTIPGDEELFAFLPWANNHGLVDLVMGVADASLRAAPNQAMGYYWKAQPMLEAVAAGQAPPALADEATGLLQRAIQLKPDYPDAQIGLANVARIRGRDDEAAAALRGLIANHPDHPEANYTLGLVLLAKSPAEALACFERGERAAPNDADYPRSKARALAALGRMPEARAAIDRARQLAPGDPRVEQVARELAGSSPAAQGMSLAIKGVVGLVLLGVFGYVGWMVYSATRTAAPPPAAATPAVTAPAPAKAPAPPPAKKK